MAQLTDSLLEEVIRTQGKCGLTAHEMAQMAHMVKVLRSQLQGAMKDAERYQWLRLNYWREILGWCFGRYLIKPEKDARLLDYHIDRCAALSASAEKTRP